MLRVRSQEIDRNLIVQCRLRKIGRNEIHIRKGIHMTCDISNSLDDNIFRQTCMFKELIGRMDDSRLIIVSILKGYGKEKSFPGGLS